MRPAVPPPLNFGLSVRTAVEEWPRKLHHPSLAIVEEESGGPLHRRSALTVRNSYFRPISPAKWG